MQPGKTGKILSHTARTPSKPDPKIKRALASTALWAVITGGVVGDLLPALTPVWIDLVIAGLMAKITPIIASKIFPRPREKRETTPLTEGPTNPEEPEMDKKLLKNMAEKDPREIPVGEESRLQMRDFLSSGIDTFLKTDEGRDMERIADQVKRILNEYLALCANPPLKITPGIMEQIMDGKYPPPQSRDEILDLLFSLRHYEDTAKLTRAESAALKSEIKKTRDKARDSQDPEKYNQTLEFPRNG